METGYEVEGTQEGASDLKDGGLSLRFHTAELSPSEMTAVMGKRGQAGKIMFLPEKIQEIQKVGKKLEGRLSPSQRLRRIYYKYWVAIDKPDGDFDDWYEKKVEFLITTIGNKLDEVS